MNKPVQTIVYSVLLSVVLTVAISAQGPSEPVSSRFLISANAGGVNLVEGPVSVLRTNGRSGYLTKRDEIAVGDKVTTGEEARAEILLNPGSYMRIGPNTTFSFESTSLDDLEVNIDHGSAMFEVYAGNEFTVLVNTPKGSVTLIESGVFRIDVDDAGMARIAVWKGKAQLGDEDGPKVKKGREAVITTGDVEIAKFDRDELDPFESWSQDRAKLLAKATRDLKMDNMRPSLISSFNMGRWNMYDSFGIWAYDPFTGFSCFMPFGAGWSSPYGFGYSNCICHGLPGYIYWYPTPHNGPIKTNDPTTTRTRDVPAYVKIAEAPSSKNVIRPPLSDTTFDPPVFAPIRPAPVPVKPADPTTKRP